MDKSRIGFVVGLRAEAALLRGTGFMVEVGGGMPAGAAAAAAALVGQGAAALVSFGLAGGLNPNLRPGAVIVPRAVAAHGGQVECDAALVTLLGGANTALLYAGAEVAVTPRDKADLFAASGADAVDLESGAVAHVAAALQLPFAVLRAIIDPADCTLPPAALIALDQAGAIGFGRVMLSLLRHPRQLPALLQLAKNAATARRALLQRIRALD